LQDDGSDGIRMAECAVLSAGAVPTGCSTPRESNVCECAVAPSSRISTRDRRATQQWYRVGQTSVHLAGFCTCTAAACTAQLVCNRTRSTLRRADLCTWFDPSLRCCTFLIDLSFRISPFVAAVGQTPANQQCSHGDAIQTDVDCKSATQTAGFQFQSNDEGKPTFQ
jgi:hypothetical protein